MLIFRMFEPYSEMDAGLMLTVHHMHSECISHVNAKAQAAYIRSLAGDLTPEETELVRRGRNAHSHHPVPKNQDPEDYAMATAFEVLIGYLHLTGKNERIACFTNKLLGGIKNG